MRQTLARIESNEALFAEANDSIAVVAGMLRPRPLVPFLCECPDPYCREIAELSLGEYAAVRLYANRFVISPHCSGHDYGGTLLVESSERFTVVDRLAAE